MGKKFTLKIIKVMKSKPKLGLDITFWAMLLITTFEDLILIFYIWVPNARTEGIMDKKIWFKQHFASTFRCLTHQSMVLMYRSTFPYTWPCLLPKICLITHCHICLFCCCCRRPITGSLLRANFLSIYVESHICYWFIPIISY